MRLRFAFAAAQAMGLFLSSEAFIPAWRSFHFRASAPIGVGDAGEDLPDENLEGAELTDEMREKLKQEDENFGGGTRFKEMMEMAQKRKGDAPAPRSMKNPFADNPYAGIEGLDPEMAPAPPETPSFDNMTVEQQAQMFRAMMQGQQFAPPAVQTGPVRPPKPDRKVGRNRDADAIQNTADVYFAQLKRDSTVRGIARIRGDMEKANAVFEDEKIEELKGLITQNPHLAGKRDEERKLIETAAEEMIAMQKAQESNRANKASTGISYKEKLAQRRNAKAGGTAAAAPAQPPAPPKVEEPVAEAPAPAAPVAEVSPPPPVVEAPPAQPEPVAPPQVEPVVAAAKPEPQQDIEAPQQQQSTSSEWAGQDEIRRGIRTLMGLILKHRGGPGFGAGGLKGDEIGHYEQLAEEVTALLKEEAQAHHTGPTEAVAAQAPAAAATAPQAAATAPAADTAPSSSSDSSSQVESMLACIEGAILMYRNSPEELKEGVLMTVRAALLSAVNTCNKVVGQNEGIPSTAGAGTNVDSMLACVEGAIQMYRNSPPELQQSVLLTVRAALLSAIGTCNKIVAENEVQNFQQYQEATADMDKPEPTPKPAQFYNVVESPKEEAAEGAPPSGTDANTLALEDIYNKLEAAAGNGKMGLREDLTAEEASELADGIAQMRSIIVEELETGIPEVVAKAPAPAVKVTNAPSGASSSIESGSTTSMYQQMLAKARANKAANA